VNVRLDLSDGTLSTEHQAVIDALDEFLALLPDDDDPNVALRLAMEILEAADVAPYRAKIDTGIYKQRLREEGLAGLFDRPIPGRPAVTTQMLVEKALFQVVLGAVMEEHALPDDGVLAERVNQVLSEAQVLEAGSVTASMVETIRLRWDIRRPAIMQQLQAAQPPAPRTSMVTSGWLTLKDQTLQLKLKSRAAAPSNLGCRSQVLGLGMAISAYRSGSYLLPAQRLSLRMRGR